MNICNSNQLPVYFLSHGGGPCFFMDTSNDNNAFFSNIDKNSNTRKFLESINNRVKSHANNDDMSKLRILVISAHWEEPEFSISYQDESNTSLIYDYYGFPPETYEIKYPAPTDTQLADRVYTLLNDNNIKCKKQYNRGFDHGVFIPLKLAFPEANIPIVQLSLKSNLSPVEHIAVGEALSQLRNENVLIIASGQTTHNLRALKKSTSTDAAALDFTNWLHQTLTEDSITTGSYHTIKNKLLNIMSEAPNARYCHPREEHLIPLLVAYGASVPNNNNSNVICKRIHEFMTLSSMSLDSYEFL